MSFKDLIDGLGWLGGLEVTLAYVLVSNKKMEGHSYAYQMLNLTGALFLIVNTAWYHAYPSTFVNIVWVGIGLHAMYKYRKT